MCSPHCQLPPFIIDIDKNFLFRGGSIGGLFWLVKGYWASGILGINKQGMTMRLGKGCGASAVFLEVMITISNHDFFIF
jgi:hypothetical protein